VKIGKIKNNYRKNIYERGSRLKSDIEIAQQAIMQPITEIARYIGLNDDDIELYGKYKAKVTWKHGKKSRTVPTANWCW
jgi:hypothetical protein